MILKKVLSRLAIAAVLSLCGTIASGQTADTITIKFDDGEGMTGQLLEVTDTSLRLDTIMGAITVPMAGLSCIGLACPDAVRQDIPDAPIVLTSLNGSVRIVGNLLGIENSQFIVATDFGEFRTETHKVICEGAGCPGSSQPLTDELGGTVRLVQGDTTIEGVLTGMDDQSYIVHVDVLGDLRVSRDFTCEGEGCPAAVN